MEIKWTDQTGKMRGLTEAKVSNQPRRLSPSVKKLKPSLDSSCSSAFRISFCFFEIRVSLRSLFQLSPPFIFSTGNRDNFRCRLRSRNRKMKSNEKGRDGFRERERGGRWGREGIVICFPRSRNQVIWMTKLPLGVKSILNRAVYQPQLSCYYISPLKSTESCKFYWATQ